MSSAQGREVVITGVGVVSPIGIGRDAYWQSLRLGISGVRLLELFVGTSMPIKIGGALVNFDGKQYVSPRKSLKVMSREIQTAFSAARLACQDAHLEPPAVDPERWGVVFGCDMLYGDPSELIDAYRACIKNGQFDRQAWGLHAMSQLFPLWMLKYLPNMPACHIGISLDARGPTNTVVQGEISSLQAFTEGCRLIERGTADVVVVGGTGSRLTTANLLFRDLRVYSQLNENPTAASRPFDAKRTGSVNGEGAGAFVLESRRHAESRRASILARVLGFSSLCEPRAGCTPPQGTALRESMRVALKNAKLGPHELGHVNAHGLGTPDHDQVEARAIRDVLGDVPVTAPKSFFGNLGAGSGAVEMAASVLAFGAGEIPRTLNYENPDPNCPVNVVHGQSAKLDKPTAMILNQGAYGQSVAVVIAGP